MTVKIELSQEAENYLIDKGCTLNTHQRENLSNLFKELEDNPEIGENKILPIPVATEYYVQRHLGNKIHVILHYDLDKSSSDIIVKIKAIYIGYMF